MARAVIRKPEILRFVLSHRFASPIGSKFAEPTKASGRFRRRDQRPDTGL
ncbi:hypothetical protein RSK20926_07122 [Roseobacter sp. SK209-2-6]|nr:hypothetical protein RSK20926_07122 [Roseobacter sp. SK209-2-6]